MEHQQPYQRDQYQGGEPTYPQSTYMQPSAYADNNMNPTSFDDGYAGRQGLAPTAPGPAKKDGFFAFMKSKWAAMFMGLTAVQAVICLCFEAYIFARFQSSLRDEPNDQPMVQSQYKTIPTFLTLFIFVFLYELIVVWDALRMKNTIQIIGTCIANLALVVYTALQVDQIDISLAILASRGALKPGEDDNLIYADLHPYLVAIPCIIALCTVCMVFLTWKLYQDFAWDILKNIGADYRMKKRFLHFQIYIALLKFDFFFFLGFIIQLVVIVTQTDDPEFALTIVTIPITIAILLAAAWFTRQENKAGMIVIIVLYHGGLTYFLFKLIRIYTWEEYYRAVQKSLTAFAVITIILILLTIVNAIICMRNFDNGLKAHLLAPKKDDENPDMHSVSLRDVKPQPSRMTID